MNKKQRLVLAIFVPIVILFITLRIADSVSVTRVSILIPRVVEETPEKTLTWEEIKKDINAKYRREIKTQKTAADGPFNWDKTWYVWMFYLIFCCIFEYKLFEDIKKRGKGDLNE